jgi:hypothetical protein
VPDTVFDKIGDIRPLRLGLRHYLEYDEDGHTRVMLSRLTALRQVPQGGQE